MGNRQPTASAIGTKPPHDGGVPVSVPTVPTVSVLAADVALLKDAVSTLQATPSDNVTWTHVQNTPEAIWTITHTLTNKFPSATVVDSAGSQVIGEVKYQGSNTVILTFYAPFSGTAYLN